MISFWKSIFILLVVIKTSPAASGILAAETVDYPPNSVVAEGMLKERKASISKTLKLNSGRRLGLTRTCFTPDRITTICIYTVICETADLTACRIDSYPAKPRYAEPRLFHVEHSG